MINEIAEDSLKGALNKIHSENCEVPSGLTCGGGKENITPRSKYQQSHRLITHSLFRQDPRTVSPHGTLRPTAKFREQVRFHYLRAGPEMISDALQPFISTPALLFVMQLRTF